MKQFKGAIIGFTVGVGLMFGTFAFADDGLTKIEAYLRPDLPIQLNGQRITLESSPVMVDGNTYLKLRDVAKLTGLGVAWNQDTQTVELSTYSTPTPAPAPISTPLPAPAPVSPSAVAVNTQPTLKTYTEGDKTVHLKIGDTYDNQNNVKITLSDVKIYPNPEDANYNMVAFHCHVDINQDVSKWTDPTITVNLLSGSSILDKFDFFPSVVGKTLQKGNNDFDLKDSIPKSMNLTSLIVEMDGFNISNVLFSV